MNIPNSYKLFLIFAYTINDIVAMSHSINRYGGDVDSASTLRWRKLGDGIGELLGHAYVNHAKQSADDPPYDNHDRYQPVPERQRIVNDLQDPHENDDIAPIQANHYKRGPYFYDDMYEDSNVPAVRAPPRADLGRIVDRDQNYRGPASNMQNGPIQNFEQPSYARPSAPLRTEIRMNNDNRDDDNNINDTVLRTDKNKVFFRTLTVKNFIFQAQPVIPNNERIKKRPDQTVYYFD